MTASPTEPFIADSGKRLLDIAVHQINLPPGEYLDLGTLHLQFLKGCWDANDFENGLEWLEDMGCIELPDEDGIRITSWGLDFVRSSE
jgi:hypothetical protein